MTRRILLMTSLVAAAPGAWAQADRSAEATQFITSFGSRLIGIVNGSGPIAEKKQQMQPLIEQAVAVDQIGQFVLGPYWRTSTQAQQQRFLQLFHEVLIANIGAKLGEFQGVGFKTTQTVQREADYYVGTLISRPNQQPNNVQWIVSMASGHPEIIDVVAEGTSLRITQKSDYASFLQQHGRNVEALLSALERQAST